MSTVKPTAWKSRTFGKHGKKEVHYPDSESRNLKLPEPPSLTVLIYETGSTITSWRWTCQTKPCGGKHCSVSIFTAHLFCICTHGLHVSIGLYHHVVHFSESLSAVLNPTLKNFIS